MTDGNDECYAPFMLKSDKQLQRYQKLHPGQKNNENPQFQPLLKCMGHLSILRILPCEYVLTEKMTWSTNSLLGTVIGHH